MRQPDADAKDRDSRRAALLDHGVQPIWPPTAPTGRLLNSAGGAAPWDSALEALLDAVSTPEGARAGGGDAADVYSLS